MSELMRAPRSELGAGLSVMLAAAFALGSGAAILPSYSLSLFAEPLAGEFAWTRGNISFAATVLWAGILFTAPVAGRLADRFGVRRIAVPSIVLTSMTFVAMSRIHGALWQLYLGYGTLAVLGAGTTTVCYSRIITLWFHRNRGFALGVMMAGGSVAAMLIPFVVEYVIRAFGWRDAWIALGVWTILAAPVVWLFLREPAEGTVASGGSEAGPVSDAEAGLTLQAAVRTRTFWFLALGNFCFALPIGALLSHLVPLLTDSGLSRAQAVQASSMIGFAGLVGRLGIGYLIDRLFAPVISAIVLLAAAVGCMLLSKVAGAALPGVFLMGLYIGSEGDLMSFLTSRYFGRAAFSEIFGWLYSTLAVGVVSGPLLAGALYDRSSGYSGILMLCSFLLLVAAILQLSLGRFPKTFQSAVPPHPITSA
jgi:MFS family permease